ncbi:MAG: translocation/assembly module TamB domain-containing protein [Bacteroidales bacterium]
MLKSIKISAKSLLIALGSMAVIFLSCMLILSIPAVQTYLAKGVSKYISKEIQSTISVSRVEFTFFNRVVVKDILIKDRNNDTLLYSPRVSVVLRNINRKAGKLNLGRITVEKPVLALITDTTGLMNLTWYLDLLKSKNDTATKRKTEVGIARVDVNNGRFILLNRKGEKSKMPVDFSNLHVNSLNSIIKNIKVAGDTTSMHISSLDFIESGGFKITSGVSDLALRGHSICFSDLYLITDSSNIRAENLFLLADTSTAFRNFVNEVRLEINLDNSRIHSSDLKYFVPSIKEFNEEVDLSGIFRGTISEFKGRDIKARYKNETLLDINFDLSGLPDINNTFIFLEVNDLRSISKDIEQFTIPGKGKIILPETLRNLGVVSYSGTFTGFIKDFVSYGRLNTNKGVISTDISMRPEKDDRFRIRGLLKAEALDLSSFAKKPGTLGQVTLEANVDGYTEGFKKFFVTVNGKVDSADLYGYRYRNIQLNGLFNDKAWDGNIKVADANINMELLGMLDFSGELPEFDFTMNLKKARLFNLNLEKKDTTSAASLLLTANFTGDNIDNLDGEIKLFNSTFRKHGKDLELYDFSLKAFSHNNVPAISLRTDFIDASLNGHYNFASLGVFVAKAMNSLVPSKYSKPASKKGGGSNNFTFDINFKNTDRLNEFLRTGLTIARNSTIKGSVTADSIFNMNGDAKTFSFGNNTLKNLAFTAFYADTTASFRLKSADFDLSGVSDLKDISLDFFSRPDRFTAGLNWDNKDKVLTKGNLSARGYFRKGVLNDKRTSLVIKTDPGALYVRNKIWDIDAAEIITDSSYLSINGFRIREGQNFLSVDGKASVSKSDTLYLKFSGINLSPINNLYEKKMNYDPAMIHLAIGGTVNGEVSVTDIFKNFMFESDINVRDFSLLESRYGNIRINSVWNNDSKVAEINAWNDFEGKKMFDIAGTYDPAARNADLTVTTLQMPLEVLNPLLKVFASGITGTATGKVKLTGELNKPYVTGSLKADNAAFRIDYLQAKYKFTDSIRFDREGISFRDVQVKDEKNNTALLNGKVFHQHFKNFTVDLNIKPTDCMVLNTKAKDNELFYGTAYASGVTSIKSLGPVLTFNISAKTGKNTRFFIPLNSGLTVTKNNFITFVPPKGADSSDIDKAQQRPVTKSSMEIGFDLEITPDAEVQLIMDPKTGDIIKGKGNGNLNISLNRKGEFKIYGDYTIEDGDYLFTLGNIINKPFSVESGGKISFNGNVEDAEIDIKAIYKTKASLYELNPGTLDDRLKKKIPVECQLLLTGRLFNPVVGFDIYLPTADEETRAYLRSMIKSDDEMSKQFLFLLVMNSFYTDPMASTSPSTAGMGSATVGVTSFEMLSNQLSNWLSQISNDFDIGVVYRPGTSLMPNSQELEFALSTQLLNDRVVINGNFGVAGNGLNQSGATTTTNNQVTGTFDIEFKINKNNDKVRLKFFNRSNDNFYIDNGIQYTQGIGLFFREDFNKLSDLFKKKPGKSDMKKEEETKAKEAGK